MQTVWEHSRATGNDLLVLLAIADNANDAGVAWPAVDTIAKKARCSERTVQRILQFLVGDLAELAVDKKAGPHQCNRYRVTLTADAKNGAGGDKLTPPEVTSCQGDKLTGCQDDTSRGDKLTGCQVDGVTNQVVGGDTAVSRGGDIAVSPDPSRTVRNHHYGAVVTDCQGDKLTGCHVDGVSSCHPSEEGTTGSLIPSEAEVLEFARTFEDLARGLSTIPEGYAMSWLAWRMEPRAGVFPKDWKADLRRRYVSSVLDKKTAAPRTPVESARSKRLEELRRIAHDPRSTPRERVQARSELQTLETPAPVGA